MLYFSVILLVFGQSLVGFVKSLLFGCRRLGFVETLDQTAQRLSAWGGLSGEFILGGGEYTLFVKLRRQEFCGCLIFYSGAVWIKEFVVGFGKKMLVCLNKVLLFRLATLRLHYLFSLLQNWVEVSQVLAVTFLRILHGFLWRYAKTLLRLTKVVRVLVQNQTAALWILKFLNFDHLCWF